MVAPASVRPRSPAPIASIGASSNRRSKGTYVLIAVPVVLALTFVWQVASSTFHTQVVVREPVGVGQVGLEADPAGARIDMVLVDRFGQETSFGGTLNISLREPDGAVWNTSRGVSAADFQPLPDDSLMAGRVGYSVTINASDWARLPRRGGLATVTISAKPSDDSPAFSTQSQQLFP